MNARPTAKEILQLLPITMIILICGCTEPKDSQLVEVDDFGSNPGDLRMFKYVPVSVRNQNTTDAANSSHAPNMDRDREGSAKKGIPLIVLLHGCLQDALEYGEASGWIRLAERWRVLLLLPEQRISNNLMRCFNWFSPDDNARATGEAFSIRQMIDRMRKDHAVDPHRIYVTGVSAGAAMSIALLSVYPETFFGGAALAGIAYGCADGLLSALSCMREPPERTASDWGRKVRTATGHRGPWPRISVWHGEVDSAVNPMNAVAIVRQWTNIHGIDGSARIEKETKGRRHVLYQDAAGRTLVESNLVKAMGHGVAVNPGPRDHECGRVGKYFFDMDLCSSFEIAKFWGLPVEVADD